MRVFAGGYFSEENHKGQKIPSLRTCDMIEDD
jgi:hypothetical protein